MATPLDRSLPAQRGLFLPPFDALRHPGRVADLAVAAERAGWDGVFVWDHVRSSPPVSAIADPWICCAAIAARTERIRFGPLRHPPPPRRPHPAGTQGA